MTTPTTEERLGHALCALQSAQSELARLSAEVARVTDERDEAQSITTAWQQVFESIEAHIKDRMAMHDPAEPETYLRIIHSDIADVIRHSQQISAARWHDYAQHKAQLSAAERARDEAVAALEKMRRDTITEAINVVAGSDAYLGDVDLPKLVRELRALATIQAPMPEKDKP